MKHIILVLLTFLAYYTSEAIWAHTAVDFTIEVIDTCAIVQTRIRETGIHHYKRKGKTSDYIKAVFFSFFSNLSNSLIERISSLNLHLIEHTEFK